MEIRSGNKNPIEILVERECDVRYFRFQVTPAPAQPHRGPFTSVSVLFLLKTKLMMVFIAIAIVPMWIARRTILLHGPRCASQPQWQTEQFRTFRLCFCNILLAVPEFTFDSNKSFIHRIDGILWIWCICLFVCCCSSVSALNIWTFFFLCETLCARFRHLFQARLI